MPLLGLTERERGLIRTVLARHPEVREARVFGSRADGTQRPASDIDLALCGIADPLRAAAIAGELDELPLPYRFDVVAFDALPAGPLRDAIERRGVPLWDEPAPTDAGR